MNTTTRTLRIAVPVAVLMLVAACGGGTTGSQWTYAPLPTGTPAPSGSPGASASPGASPSGSPGASPSGSPGASPSGSPGASPSGEPSGEVIELTETAALQITQGGQPVTSLTVQAGQTYTFRITNEATFVHDFYIGPPDALQAGTVDGLPGVPEFASATQEFTYTVTDETASLEFACTVPGHYGPMHGTFTVQP